MSRWSQKKPDKMRDTRFALYIHHGGYFTRIETDEFYVGGFSVPRLDLDADKFGYFDLVGEARKLGYVSWNGISYKVPNSFRYKHVESDKEVMEMLENLSSKVRVLHVFVDKGKKVEQEVSDNDEEPEFEVDGGENVEGNEGGNVEGSATIGEGNEVLDSESEDSDYIPSENEYYSDDDMGDEEYIEARRALRDQSNRSLCDEIFATVGQECGFYDYERSDGDVDSKETDEDGEPRHKRRMKRVVYDERCDHKNLNL